MRYDFDKVIDRTNAPYSYSLKWMNKGPAAEALKEMNGDAMLAEDSLRFFTADMDFQCAPELIEAMIETAKHGIYGYSCTPAEYRPAICRWFKDRFDWDFKPEDIYAGWHGTHELIANCVKTYTNPGDGVIVLTPSYSFYADIEPLGREFVAVPMINTDSYYTIDFDAFEKACKEEKNTMFVTMQPHNPVGRVWTVEEMQKMADICRQNSVIIVCDSVHIDIARKNQKVIPFAKAVGSQGIIIATAINKTFNAAGLSMSNLIIEDPVLKEKYPSNPFEMATPFGISAVIAAYTKCDDWVDQLNEYLDKTLSYAVDRFKKDLPKAKVSMPEGTYVLWVDFSGYGLSDEELSKRFDSVNVLVTNGKGFGMAEGEQYKRICLTAPMVIVEEMCNRLEKAFAELN